MHWPSFSDVLLALKAALYAMVRSLQDICLRFLLCPGPQQLIQIRRTIVYCLLQRKMQCREYATHKSEMRTCRASIALYYISLLAPTRALIVLMVYYSIYNVHSHFLRFSPSPLILWLLWCSIMFYDILWCSMMFYDVLWCSMMFYGVLWCSVIFYDALWCSMMSYDVLWCSMMF